MLRNINKYKFLFVVAFILHPSSLILHPSSLILLYGQTKVTPIINASLLGGQYFLDDETASFEGKLDAFVSPVIRISEYKEIIPVYSGYYNGTQDIQELAGGGVLTRERQNHTLSVKYIFGKDFNKFKPRVSYSKSFVKETKDEDWGNGLFDYDTLSAGLEMEQERPYGTWTQSYDYYQVKYPNYSTLLSNSETAIGTTTFNELSKNAGTDIMDNINHRLSVSYTWFPEPLILQISYEGTYRKYPDQSIIAKPKTGSPYFKSDKRTDFLNSVYFKATRPMKPLNLSLSSYVTYLTSNQNSYDSSRTKYIDDYYSYVEVGLAPGLNFHFKNNSAFSFSVALKKLYYLGRLAQDASGNYSSTKTHQTTYLSNISTRYPLTNRFFARASYNYQISDSNMKYEANYRYNYRASTYLFGIEWEF